MEYRQSYALGPSNGEAGVGIANLQQEPRDRIEAARVPPRIEAMRGQAREEMEQPLPDPASDELLVLEFAHGNLSAILASLGNAGGINVTCNNGFADGPASLDLVDVTFEEAPARLLSSHGVFHKVVNPTTTVVPETPEKRRA